MATERRPLELVYEAATAVVWLFVLWRQVEEDEFPKNCAVRALAAVRGRLENARRWRAAEEIRSLPEVEPCD